MKKKNKIITNGEHVVDQRVQEICKEEIRAAVRRMESLRLLVQMAYMWRDGDVQESAGKTFNCCFKQNKILLNKSKEFTGTGF